MDPYTVVRDTREKEGKGWVFSETQSCAGTVTQKLDTGDYSLYGWESHISIERKGSVSELAKNLTEERFENELIRLEEFPWRYVILEFDMKHIIEFPKGSGIPKRRQRYMKVSGYYLLKRITELERKYKIQFMFCGAYGKEVCANIFKRFMESKTLNEPAA